MKTVFILGLASFFTDLSSEMIYPLIPVFLSQTLGASALQLGIVEGVAESTSALMKVASGIFVDHFKKKKSLIVVGYSLSGFIRPLIGLAAGWKSVLFVRFFDRVGKGIRTSPRDALIAEVTDPAYRGRAFGLHRSMDHAGAVGGPLLATSLLALMGLEVRTVFYLAAIPALITVIVLVFGIKEKSTPFVGQQTELNLKSIYDNWKNLGAKYKKFIFAMSVFSLGNASDAFLILHLSNLGVSAHVVTILWAAHNAIKMLSTYLGGRFSDRIGHLNSIIIGWLLYSLAYFSMGYFKSPVVVIGAFLAYGIFYGLTEPGERAFVANLVPGQLKGSAYGFFHSVVGLMALPASILFGIVWKLYGASFAFLMGGAISIVSANVLYFTCKNERN